MTSPAPDPKLDPVRAAIDSTLMLVLARFFMPAVVAVLGWLLAGNLDDLKHNNERLRTQAESTTAVSATTAAKLDLAMKQLDRLQRQVDDLGRRN